MTGVFLSVPRYDSCAPLSHPSSCMLVNHGPSQQRSKEEYKPWKRGATARHYTSHTKDHVTNEEVRAKIQQATGPQEDLLTIVLRSSAKFETKQQNNLCFATSMIVSSACPSALFSAKWQQHHYRKHPVPAMCGGAACW